MSNILVTGGAGFLGSHLVEQLLAEGHQVTVLDDLSDAPLSNLSAVKGQYQLIQADVRDPLVVETIGQIDIIYHLAANANVPRSVKEPLHDGSVNILGTINMLALAHKHNARFFLASSGAVYGEPQTVPMAEDHIIKPISPYGASKYSAEQYVQLYKHLYDVKATIVRFFNMYGPRQRRFVVFDFAHKILAPGDEIVMLGDGRQMRGQLFVTDAVKGLLLVTEKGTEDIYNIGSANSFSITSLMETMLPLFDVQKSLAVSNKSWDGDIQRLVADISKIQALGFEEDVSLEEGILKFKEWFLETYYQQEAV
ncbi:MAG TPA: GDP-mannose 4,6-dehydratase [Anaerolineae bacterium]|nr:GDP-mannose 4,6-dehydratase [Anaerolineae bacterium]